MVLLEGFIFGAVKCIENGPQSSVLLGRYVYGHGVDGSDRPSYLLWPRRRSDGHFWLMDPRSGEFFDPAKATFIASLGLKHFFDAFALEHKRDVRVDAARALELDDEDILPNLVVKQELNNASSHQYLFLWIPRLRGQRR